MGGSIDKKVLNNLNLTHPWADFLSFCEERYSIFLKKEANLPRPWTTDTILHNYKFTNLFREDDTVSRFIFEWVKDLPFEDMLANLIYARLCNKPSTMLATGHLDNPVKFIEIIDNLGGGKTKAKVNKNAVWKGPYQVAGTFKSKLGYPYREQLIAYHIPKTITKLAEIVLLHKGNDLYPTIVKMNKVWGYENNMVFTQVLLDLSFLRPDLIPITAIPPALSGLEPIANMLGLSIDELIVKAKEQWNLKSIYKDRVFQSKDAEHALCEWRKYLCWSNGLSNPRNYR